MLEYENARREAFQLLSVLVFAVGHASCDFVMIFQVR